MWTIYKKLNVSPNSFPLVIPIKQYSSDFALKFKLYSTDGDLNIEAGATTKIRGTKRDGNGFELTGTRIGNTCTFSGTKAQMQQMTAAHGRCVFEIVVEKNTKELITANFYLEVQRAAMDAGTVTSESIINEFADFQSKITAAQASAATATEKASEAISSATTASQSALTAESASESAMASATASAESASQASQSADTASGKASDASGYASNANTSAQTASQKASEAAASADRAEQAAESVEVYAENARKTAENGRVSAETGRVNAENARVTAENGRVTAENARVEAEAARVTAENGRVTAENTRQENATIVLNKANEAVEIASRINEASCIYDSDNDVKYAYAIYAQRGVPHMSLTKITV